MITGSMREELLSRALALRPLLLEQQAATEERTFFAKTAAMGPLTYGRIKAVTNAAPPVARGVRLDVRA